MTLLAIRSSRIPLNESTSNCPRSPDPPLVRNGMTAPNPRPLPKDQFRELRTQKHKGILPSRRPTRDLTVDSHQRLDSYAPACGDRWVLFLPKNKLLFHLLSFFAKQPISSRLLFFVLPDFFSITSCSIGAYSAECSLHN
jgi:hypothetical protein